MSEPPLVVSFYTENTPYQLEAMSLIASCNDLGIQAEIEAAPCQGSWERNCVIKPFFIRKKLLEKKRPLFWVDADAVFKKRPDFSFLLESDLSFREMKRFSLDKRLKIATGSLFLNYTPRTLAFVDQWCAECQRKIDRNEELELADQITLIDLIDRGQPLKILPLPIPYCKVFDLDAMEVDADQIVIEHFQASRRYRYWTR